LCLSKHTYPCIPVPPHTVDYHTLFGVHIAPSLAGITPPGYKIPSCGFETPKVFLGCTSPKINSVEETLFTKTCVISCPPKCLPLMGALLFCVKTPKTFYLPLTQRLLSSTLWYINSQKGLKL